MEATATVIELEAELFALQERKYLILNKLKYGELTDAGRSTLSN